MELIRSLKFTLMLVGLIGLTNIGLSAEDTYSRAIDRLLRDTPQSTLRDIYKSFFQDRFGPGHILTDTASARAYLHRELTEMDVNSLPLIEPAGCGKNFVRVNLSVIKAGIISEEAFFEAFVDGASSFQIPAIDGWKEEWAEILSFVPDTISGFETDKAAIDSLLTAGKYAMHHSLKYNDAYHPHYRIVAKSICEDKISPILKSHNAKHAK